MSENVTRDTTSDWLTFVFTKLLEDFLAKDIFNADGTEIVFVTFQKQFQHFETNSD